MPGAAQRLLELTASHDLQGTDDRTLGVVSEAAYLLLSDGYDLFRGPGWRLAAKPNPPRSAMVISTGREDPKPTHCWLRLASQNGTRAPQKAISPSPSEICPHSHPSPKAPA